MSTVQIPVLAQAPQGSQTTRALQSGRQTQQRSAVLVPRLLAPHKTKKGEAVRKGDFLLAALDDSYTGWPGQVDYFERRRREASGEDGSRRQRTASRRSTGHSIKQPFSSAGRTRTHGFRSRLSQVHVQGQTLCSYRMRSSACLPHGVSTISCLGAARNLSQIDDRTPLVHNAAVSPPISPA